MRDILNIITQHEGRFYKDIIQKYLLIRVRFTKNKDYVIMDNNFISCKLQIKI